MPSALALMLAKPTLMSFAQNGTSPQRMEGGGFELPVPRAMQARLKAKIAASAACRRPSSAAGVDHLRLPSVAISSGAKRNLGTEPLSRAEPEVRIHLPPARSLRTIG